MKTREKTEKDLTTRKFIKTIATGMGTALLAGIYAKNVGAQNTQPPFIGTKKR